MQTLPPEIVRVLRRFEGAFSARVWEWATVLLVGAILAPGQRTVASALRVMGLGGGGAFQNYHRGLNRARWSSREPSRILLGWLRGRTRVVVADSSYAVLELLADAAGLRQPVTVVTRLRLDAALYDPAPERHAGTQGRPRLKGARQPTLARRLGDPRTRWD